MQLSLEQALKNLEDLAAAYRGTLQEHAALQESLKIVREAIKKAE